MLHNYIKSQTADLHSAVESVPIIQDLATGRIDRQRFGQLTEKMYGFWGPLEAKLERINLPVPWSRRVQFLSQDLFGLGLTADDIDSLTICDFSPNVTEVAEGLGVAYVYQGSQMGGVLIHRALEKSGLIPEDCRTFYAPGKEKTSVKWPAFTRALNDLQVSSDQRDLAAHAARQTFFALMRWL
ncbi:MAG: biliverdin-producing heme oxygenase [Rhodospirillaceae bacterium]